MMATALGNMPFAQRTRRPPAVKRQQAQAPLEAIVLDAYQDRLHVQPTTQLDAASASTIVELLEAVDLPPEVLDVLPPGSLAQVHRTGRGDELRLAGPESRLS